MAGELTATLLLRLDTLLDQTNSASSYWTTTELYASLTDGQRELVALFLGKYKTEKGALPNVLRPLLANASGSITKDALTVTLPSGFLHALSVKYKQTTAGSLTPCIIRDPANLYTQQANYYLVGAAPAPFAWFDGTNINFEPAADTDASYVMEYLAMPSAIAAGTDPTLPQTCYEAIVVYALGELLTKDQRSVEAEQQFTKFYNLAQALYA